MEYPTVKISFTKTGRWNAQVPLRPLLDAYTLFGETDEAFEGVCAAVSGALKRYNTLAPDKLCVPVDIIYNFEFAGNEDDFNYVLQDLYDWGDEVGVWVSF